MSRNQSPGSEDFDDAIEFFIEEMTFHGRSSRTCESYKRILRDFESFLEDYSSGSLKSATRRDCMNWVHNLRGTYASSTVASYAGYLNRFYAYMNQVGVYDSNPMGLVLTEMNESIDTDPARREIQLHEIRSFVQSINHPLHLAIVGTLLKTGMRVGECCNLDLRDINIIDNEVNSAYEYNPRGAIDNRPDTLFVDSSPTFEEEFNGEKRSATNKRTRDTIIPIDEELKSILKIWLAIRPDTSAGGNPLFCSTNEWGSRLTPSMVRSSIKPYTSNFGWYRVGGGSEENVTPHYFRHFFTTHLRDRTGDRGIVKYIRGDVADDIIDTYTHNWGDRVRQVYINNIYRIL